MEEIRSISFEIAKISRLIKRYIDNHTNKAYVDKLTGAHGWAIGYFYANRDKDIFQKDFEKMFNIRRSSATSMLKLMEKNGLIKRESVDYDARLKKITLTKKAIEIHNIVNKDFNELQQMLTKNLSEDELECFFNVLSKITNNIEEADKQ